jgi:excinuclease ABC subunit C
MLVRMEKDHKSITTLPDTPGVYFFVGKQKKVLYVGKATSLRDRVRSYFAADLVATRGAHMARMVEEAVKVEYRETRSVLHALVLEAELIKSLHPPYNTREKDDKSFNYVVVTMGEQYPRFLTVRGKDLERVRTELVRSTENTQNSGRRTSGVFANDRTPSTVIGKGGRGGNLKEQNQNSKRNVMSEVEEALPTFGPFVHARQFKEALAIVRKIFPFYDTKKPVAALLEKRDAAFRFNESIGKYPPHGTTPSEYRKTVRHLLLFFKGKQLQLERTLEREMHAAAQKEQFEVAAERKRQLFALQHIQDVSLLTREEQRMPEEKTVRIEAYDVAHLRGKYAVGVMVVVEGGEPQKKEYRSFKIRSVDTGGDVPALKEILSRRLAHTEWEYPQVIVVDGGQQQLRAGRSVLKEAGVAIPVVAVTKDDKHRPRSMAGDRRAREQYAPDILLANAESHRFAVGRMRHAQARA